MPTPSTMPQNGMMPRATTAPVTVMTPRKSRSQPIHVAITSSVGPGQVQTAIPTPSSSRPTTIDHARMDPSIGTLNRVKKPLNTSTTPTTNARSATLQSVRMMMPPATALSTPLTSRAHQPLLMFSTWSLVHEPGPNGLVTSTTPPSK